MAYARGRVHHEAVRRTRGHRPGPAATAVAVACVCAGCSGLIDVGSDLPGEGGATTDGGVEPSDAPGEAASDGLTVALSAQSTATCSACLQVAAQATGGVPPYTYSWDPPVAADGGVAQVCPTGPTSYTVTVTDSSLTSGELPGMGARVSKTLALDAPDGCAGGVQADSFVYWANWQSYDGGAAEGVISLPSGDVHVSFTGALVGAQTTSGTNVFVPAASFTSPTVADAPPTPSMLELMLTDTTAAALLGNPDSGTDVLAFSTTVQNPVVAVYALGSAIAGQGSAFFFGLPCQVLASGPSTSNGYVYWDASIFAADGGVLANGGNGVFEVEGAFGSLQWPGLLESLSANGSYTGFTVGLHAH
jgi:hypothetical protein